MAIVLDTQSGLQLRGSTTYTVLIASVAALGSVMFGFDIAIISGAIPFIQAHFQLNELQLGWAVSSLLIGCMIGSLRSGRAADAFGRKRTLLSIALVFAATSALTALAPNLSLFVIARIIGGIAVGAASMVAPMYVAEIAPCNLRGRMVALNQLGITFGILASYLINYLLRGVGSNNWRWMFASGALPSIAFFLLLFKVPESPRWLFQRDRRAEADAVLTRIGGSESAERELRFMDESLTVEQSSGGRLFSPQYRRLVVVGILLAILVQASGINTVIEYAPIILRSAGNGLDMAMFQTFVIGIINFLFTFVAVWGADKVGRRPLYISGSIGMALSLICISFGFYTGRLQGYVGLVLILFFIASFAGCIGPVFWILMSEMFPGRIRGRAMSLAVTATWVSNFLVVLLFPWLFNHLGGGSTFAFITVMAVLMAILAWKFIPETKGKTLEEISVHWQGTQALADTD